MEVDRMNVQTRKIQDVVKQFQDLEKENPNAELCPYCFWIIQTVEDDGGVRKYCPNELCECDEGFD
jgi:hypothetical protein